MKKNVLFLVLTVSTVLFITGCSKKGAKTDETVKQNDCVISKTCVDIITDQTVKNEIIDGKIYSLSGDNDSGYNVSVFNNDGENNVFESLQDVADVFIDSSGIYTCKDSQENTEVGIFDFSGNCVNSITVSSAEITDIYTDKDGNVNILYISGSDFCNYLEQFDAGGMSKSKLNLNEKLSIDNSEYIQNVAVDKNKDVYVVKYNYLTEKYFLLKYDSDFKTSLFEEEISYLGNKVDDIFINEDDDLVLSGYDDDECYITITDTKSNVPKNNIELSGVQSIYDGSNNNICYVRDGIVFFCDVLSGKETIITEIQDDVADMYYYNDELILCKTQSDNVLNFRISDTNNNISFENSFSFESDYYISDSCFSKSNKVFILLNNNSKFKLGVYGDKYNEYELELDVLSNEKKNLKGYSLVTDDENVFFIYENDVYSYDIESQKLDNLTKGNYESIKDIGIFDGRLFVLHSTNNKAAVSEYIKTDTQMKELLSLDNTTVSDNDSILSGNNEYIFFLNSGNKLLGYKEDLNYDVMIDWNNSYRQLYVDSMYVVEKNKYLCVLEDTKVYIVENLTGSKIIRMSVALLGSETFMYEQYLQGVSEKYDIKLTRYSDYDQNGDNGIGQFNLDISSGNIPDIIITSNGALNLDLYRNKGLLESLDKYIEADYEINREDYVQSVFDLNSYENSLYYLTPQIYLKTILSKASKEDLSNLTVSELNDMLERKYSDFAESVFGSEESLYILSYLLSVNKDFQSVEKDGTYNVDNADFRAILNIAKKYGNVSASMSLAEMSNRFSSDEQIFLIDSIMGFDLFNIYEKGIIGEKVAFNAVSNDKSDRIAIECVNSLCITSSCKDKDKAWEFVRMFIMDDYQDYLADQLHFGFPVKKSALKKMLKNSQNRDFLPDELTLDGKKIKTGFISDDKANEIISMIDDCDLECKMDPKILAIIFEEADKYFRNEKTMDDIIKTINSKVNLYLNEIK